MARLAEFFGTDEEAIQELLQVFAESLPVIVARAKVSLNERNATLNAAAHEIKGASANIGASTLAHLAAELEKATVTGHWPEADGLFSAIEIETQRIKTFIQHWKH
ncbi:MAG: Hpt domain-containing protein [Rhodocyclaceae bacterium]|nr:Hpt domain-containing protein [Rhodocyclaceae bacterium]